MKEQGIRQVFRSLVERGDILKAMEVVCRYNGISKFFLETNPESGLFYTMGVLGDSFYAGQGLVGNLNEVVTTRNELAERGLYFLLNHEFGHRFEPATPVKIGGKSVPYSSSQIKNSQLKAGMNLKSGYANIQRESQANMYAIAKCREGGSDTSVEDIAISFWHNAIHTKDYHRLEEGAVKQRIYGNGANLEKLACNDTWTTLKSEGKAGGQAGSSMGNISINREDIIRILSYAYARASGYSVALKPKDLRKIIDKVAEIDRDYQSRLE